MLPHKIIFLTFCPHGGNVAPLGHILSVLFQLFGDSVRPDNKVNNAVNSTCTSLFFFLIKESSVSIKTAW